MDASGCCVGAGGAMWVLVVVLFVAGGSCVGAGGSCVNAGASCVGVGGSWCGCW